MQPVVHSVEEIHAFTFQTVFQMIINHLICKSTEPYSNSIQDEISVQYITDEFSEYIILYRYP